MISESTAQSVLARYRRIREIEVFLLKFKDRMEIKISAGIFNDEHTPATVDGARFRDFLRAEAELLRAEIKSLSEEPE